MALNANALITVLEATGFGATQSTGNLELLINGVSQAFEDYCGRVFRSLQSVTGTPSRSQLPLEYYQGTGTQELRLRRYPITAISRIRVGGTEISAEELADCNKLTHLLEDGYLYRRVGWPISCQTYGDLTGDANPSSADYSIDVAYTGGYTTIPPNLKLACLSEVLAGERAGALARSGITSEKYPGGYAVTYASDSRNWSASTISLLSNFRRGL